MRAENKADTKVQVRAITKRYGNFLANDNISLDIHTGEFITLLGSSGCGKSTLMRIIAGLEQRDCGSIVIDGRDVTDEPPRKRNLGMVFQQYSLFPHMTIWENIAYGLQVKGMSQADIKHRVKEMLDLIQLPGIDDRKPSQLSGGQQQRVALARALATRPSLLMLDEPLGALDVKLRRQLQEELKRIHTETNATFLFVTHDQEEALYLSDRIAVMRAGRFEQIGTPREVYAEPANEFVADFIGDVCLLDYKPAAAPGRVVIDGCGEVGVDFAAPAGKSRLVVRPEHVRLHPQPSDATLSATVEGVANEGGASLYRLKLQNGTVLKARRLGAPDGGMEIGRPVHVDIAGVTQCL